MSKSKPQKQSAPRPAQTAAAQPKPQAQSSVKSGGLSGDFFQLLIALVATVFSFYPSLSNEFVNWDDEPNLLENEQVMQPMSLQNTVDIFTSDVIGNYNPLPIFTFNIEYQFVQFKPFLYHFNNLVLHLLCVFFVFRISRRLGLSSLAAMFVALLFGVHPMRVESVAWVTERKDVLFGVFYLAALNVYIRQQQTPVATGRYWATIMTLTILALFAKVQAVSLPLSMLAIDYLNKRPISFKLIWEKWHFFLLSLAFGLINVYMLRENKSIGDDTTGFGFPERLLIGAYSYMVYLGKLIFPWEMSPLYPYPDKLSQYFYVAPVGVAAVAALAWVAYKREWRNLLFGILFFTFNVMFMLQIVGAGQGFIADRFTYIPYLGLFFLWGWFIDQVILRRPDLKAVVQGAFGAYIALFALLTMRQCDVWKRGDALWGHVLKYYPNVSTPWNNRAQVYRKDGEKLRAEGRVEEGNQKLMLAYNDLTQSLKLKPNVEAYNVRGKIFFDFGKIDSAFIDYTNAVVLDSVTVATGGEAKKAAVAEILINRAAVWGMQGKGHLAQQQKEEAYKKFNLAVFDATRGMSMIDTLNWLGFRNRYLAYMDIGNITGDTRYMAMAVADQDSILNFIPDKKNDPTALFDRGVALLRINRFADGIASMTAAINTLPPGAPQLPGFYRERAKAHFSNGDITNAKADAQKAASLGATDIPADMLR